MSDNPTSSPTGGGTTTPDRGPTPRGQGPLAAKWCGGFGIPAFLWPDDKPCPGVTSEVNTHGPLPTPDLTGPIDAAKSTAQSTADIAGTLKDAAGTVKDGAGNILAKLTSASFWKGVGLLLGAILVGVAGLILLFREQRGDVDKDYAAAAKAAKADA